MRQLYSARLERRILLSATAQCYHLEFSFLEDAAPAMEAGQFLSLVADDPAGKTYTRAYSLASAPEAARFDLCVNRVEGGFFSNLLCDLEEGARIQCHGPHGLFTLRQPMVDGLMIAAGTGIAPLRGFLQSLFLAGRPDGAMDGRPARLLAADRSEGREFWLIYEAPRAEEFFYDEEFRLLAAAHPNFHYVPVLGRDGAREETMRAIAHVAGERLPGVGTPVHSAVEGRGVAGPHAYGYVCGLSEIVKSVRAQMLALGWEKRQILFERYD